MRKSVVCLFACALALGVIGCGAAPEDESGQPLAQVQQAVTHDELASLQGTYALRSAVATIEQISLPGMGDQQRSLFVSYGYATLSLENEALVLREYFCRADSRTSSPAKSSIGDKAMEAIPHLPIPLEITKTQEGALQVYRPFVVIPLGANLADPNEPLPTTMNDPRLVDIDGDGKPGMTAEIKLLFIRAKVYAARRENYDFTMVRNPQGHLVGTTVDKGEMSVVGASLSMFAKNVPSSQDPDLSKSTVVMIPMESTSKVSCKTITSKMEKLFPNYPLPTKI